MIGQSLSNTNETCYSVQIAKIYNLNKASFSQLPKAEEDCNKRPNNVRRKPTLRMRRRFFYANAKALLLPSTSCSDFVFQFLRGAAT